MSGCYQSLEGLNEGIATNREVTRVMKRQLSRGHGLPASTGSVEARKARHQPASPSEIVEASFAPAGPFHLNQDE